MKPLGAAAASDRQCQQDKNEGIFEGSHWGDSINSGRTSNSIRCSFVNINGIGMKRNNYKSNTIKQYMIEHNVDVMGLAELGVNWKTNSQQDSIWERTLRWFQNMRLSVGYNKRDKFTQRSQPGGTAVLTQDRIALGICKNGSDERNLGRWTWSIFEGKEQKRTRFVSVYVPIRPANYGDNKVFYQHQRALIEDEIKTDPIEQFWIDFWSDVDKWLAQGEELVIMGDWNTDVVKDTFLSDFEERGLRPAVTGRHDGTFAPATHYRGQNTIDEAFVTSGIQIMKAGFLKPGHLPTDHLGLFFDIYAPPIIGNTRTDIPRSPARRLQCTDPRAVKKYLHVFNKYLRKHDFYVRLLVLAKTYSTPLTADEERELEKLDKLRHNGMLLAEEKCRKFKMGNFFWSLPFQNAKDMLRYVTLTLSRKKGAPISARLMIRLSKKVESDLQHASIADLEKELIVAQKAYNEVCRNSEELRRSYLEDLAVALENEGKGNKATILRVLNTREIERRMYRRIKNLKMAGAGSLSTSFVNVKNEDGTITSISKKEDLEQAIIAENIKKYHQCENTPFFKEPLLSDFGRFGEGPATEQVANGTYQIPPNVDEVTADFIRECKQTDEIKKEGTYPLPRSPQDFQAYWKRMKEKTASREVHFGHFKAGMQNDLISVMHWMMAEIPMRTGYTLNRWKQATDVMILKKSGLYDVEKLRTIVLFEADFNANNKYMGRSAIRHCVKHNRLAQEQYSIPGRKSIDHALNKRLLFDIVRYQKYSLALSSCDLKSNYDRIGHVPSVLATQRLGIPNEPMFSMYRGVQEMKHTTRTAYGDSTIKYGGLENGYLFYQQGVYQGNGFGPPGWGLISSTLFDMMRKKGFGSRIISPITNKENKLIGFAFVDDTDILASTPNQNDPDQTFELMQQTIDYWEAAAKTTGGAIAPEKSWYYLIHFKWDNGKWSYGDPTDLVQEQLTCLNKDDVRIPLKSLQANQAEEMLGVHLAPDGTNERQLQEMLKKVNTKATQLKTGYVNRYEAWVALTKVACKSVDYPLPALTLKQSECTKIMTPLLKAYLPRSGFNQHFPHALLYGTPKYKGMGMKNLFTTQNVAHIADFVDHVWQKTPTGHFFVCALESLQLEVGLDGNILNLDYSKYHRGLLTESLIRDMWKFMSENAITIDLPHFAFSRAAKNDSLIMEAVYLHCDPTTWKAMNRCRHYLRVLTVSDISTSDGFQLHPAIFQKRRRSDSFHPDINWPLWQSPSANDWSIWRKQIKIALSRSPQNALRQPLGRWYDFPPKWQWHYDTNKKQLVEFDGKQWYTHEKSSISPRLFNFSPNIHMQLPSYNTQCLIPVTVEAKPDRIIMHALPQFSSIPAPSSSHNNNCYTVTYQITLTGTFEGLCSEFVKGNVICVSDGSFQPSNNNIATAAWTICTTDGKHKLQGLAIVPGDRDQNDAYRAELTGIIGIIEMLQIIYQQVASLLTTKAYIELFCDGKSVLDKLSWITMTTCSTRLHHSDLLSYATVLLATLPLKVKFTHVKGHQDTNVSYEALSLPARLNIKMDMLAKSFGNLVFYSPDIPSHPPLLSNVTLPAVLLRKKRITGKLRQDLYDKIHESKQKQYWIGKGLFNETTHNFIDWDVHNKGFSGLRHSRKVFHSKWCTGFCATGKAMTRWQCREQSNCPFCNFVGEDTAHILHCQHTEATLIWTNALDNFITTLSANDTNPLLRFYIRLELEHWHASPNSNPPYSLPPDIAPAILQQRQIGWRRFLEGLISIELLNTQRDYFTSTDTIKHISSWGTSVLRGGSDLLFEVWQGRNQKIHNTPKLGDLEGAKILHVAIENEFKVGRNRLPPRFQRYFQVGIQKVLNETLTYRKNWFRTVRRARELYDDDKILEDEFNDHNSYFRKWVHLDPP